MSIFSLPDVDIMWLTHLDLLEDYSKLLLVSRYYHQLITTNEEYRSWRRLHRGAKKYNVAGLFYTEKLYQQAVHRGDWLARYLVQRYQIRYITNTALIICSLYNLELAEWLYEYYDKQVWYDRCYFCYTIRFRPVSGIRSFQWFMSQFVDINKEYLLHALCQCLTPETIRWFCSTHNVTLSGELVYQMFNRSLRARNMQVVKWLASLKLAAIPFVIVQNNPEYDLSPKMTKDELEWFLDLADERGWTLYDYWLGVLYRYFGHLEKLDVVKWLDHRFPGRIPLSHKNETFQHAIVHGHLDVVKWMVESTTVAFHEQLIDGICRYNIITKKCMIVFKWLQKVYPIKITANHIHQLICLGRLKDIKWMFWMYRRTNGIPYRIDSQDKYFVDMICNRQCPKMLAWLRSMEPVSDNM